MAKEEPPVPEKVIIQQLAVEEADKEKAKTPNSKKAATSPAPKSEETKGNETSASEADKKREIPREHRQRRLFKRTRAGVVLTREEVKEIKKGRKKLRKERRRAGIKKKKDFEVTASSLGLYFDKNKFLGFLRWLFTGKGLWALLGALLLLLAVLLIISFIGQIRGHFTINLDEDLFREGFSLSETIDFHNPTTNLFAQPATEVPCVSITSIPKDINDIDGEHNDQYFAFTYYIRNEGESTVAYDWTVSINSESLKLSKAAWVMIFEDDVMSFYAQPNRENGEPEYIPPMNDSGRGYLEIPTSVYLGDPSQLMPVKTQGSLTYYRTRPIPFLSDITIATGKQELVAPQQVHKYTTVIWLEGDDPDCTDELIGGHLGLEMDFKLRKQNEAENEDKPKTWWEQFWGKLRFWEE